MERCGVLTSIRCARVYKYMHAPCPVRVIGPTPIVLDVSAVACIAFTGKAMSTDIHAVSSWRGTPNLQRGAVI